MSLFENNLFKEGMFEGDSVNTVSFFLLYPKSKHNPKGDPVPKQSSRSTILPRKDVPVMTKEVMIGGVKKTEKYYRIKDLWISHYTEVKVTEAEASLKEQVRLKSAKYKFLPFEKKISVEALVFIFSPLKTMTKKEKDMIESGGYILKDTNPDLTDNSPKIVFDALQGILYKNDSRIVQEKEIYKVYGKNPGVYIKLKGEI